MRTRTGTGLLIALFLAFSLLCSVSLIAQDKLLTNYTGMNANVADPAAVNCSAYAADQVTCIAGQYYHSDNTLPSTSWVSPATATSFGGWTEASGSTYASSGCLSCHHGSVNTTTQAGGPYLIGGHKNILRKVVPGEILFNTSGVQIGNPTQFSPYFVAGWTATQTEADSGSCFRCHTTGYRFDGSGPEPTSVTGTVGSFAYTPITSAQMPRVPAGGVTGTTSSWSLTGIQCERCHKADMQYDATVVTTQYNATGNVATSTNGRVSHLVSVFVDPSNIDTSSCVWVTSTHGNSSNCNIKNTVKVGDFYIGGTATAVGATQTNLLGNGTFTARPLPNPPYALTCVECHQTGKTWTATGTPSTNQIGAVHLVPLPGFEALAPAQTSATKYAPANTLSGQYSATFACSVTSITIASEATKLSVDTTTMAGLQAATAAAYNDCVAANGTVTYTPGGMSHGIVATFLNSPHARVAGYVDTKNPGTPDSTLSLTGGTVAVKVGSASSTVNVPGTFNTHFASTGINSSNSGVTGNGITGSCAGCHDIHGAMSGYFNPAVNATNQDNIGTSAMPNLTQVATCTSCHQDGSRYSIANPAHSQGTGTPFGIMAGNGVTQLESCVVCHMAAVSTGNLGEYHFLRINSDVAYNTFPTAQQYYTTYGSGIMAPLNTYVSTWNHSTETYTDGNSQTQNYPAVGLDVDIACGQCHTGGDGTKNPYGINPSGAPVFTRAQLASYAKGIHNSAPTVALSPTFSLPGSTYQANAKTSVIVTIKEAVAGATICYTTDNTTPTYVDAGLPYGENVVATCTGTSKTGVSGATVGPITQTTTLRAIAAGANSLGQPLTPSAVVTATYTIQATTPTLSAAPGAVDSVHLGQYNVQQTVMLNNATAYCTAAPTAAACTPTTAVSVPLTISVPTTVRVINAPTGLLASAITTATFNIVPATPTFLPGSGTITKGNSVTITGPAGSTIYYTTDGSTPSATHSNGSGTNGTASVAITASEYLRAVAVYTGGYTSGTQTATATSGVATAVYTAK